MLHLLAFVTLVGAVNADYCLYRTVDLCPPVNCSGLIRDTCPEGDWTDCNAFQTVHLDFDTADSLEPCVSNFLYVDNLYITGSADSQPPTWMTQVRYVNNYLSVETPVDAGLLFMEYVGGDVYVKGTYDTFMSFGFEVEGVMTVDYEDTRKACANYRVGSLVSEQCRYEPIPDDTDYEWICCSSAERVVPGLAALAMAFIALVL